MSGLAAVPTPPVAERPAVIVAYASALAADAIAARLGDDSAVSLVPALEAVRRLRQGDTADVLVLCPYVSRPERMTLLWAARSHPRRPIVISIRERDGEGLADLEAGVCPRDRGYAAARRVLSRLVTA